MTDHPKIDWSKSSDDTVREIVREAEAFIAAQVQLATAADQRASVMASVFAAAGAALVAGLIALVGAEHADGKVAIYIGGGLAAGLFLVGAALCVSATLPTGFDLPGGEPNNWRRDVESGRPVIESLREQAENYQGKIDDNGGVLRANAKRFKWGALLGLAAPFVGFVVWFLASSCRIG